MKSLEQIEREWQAGDVPASVAMDEVIAHLRDDNVDAIIAGLSPKLRERMEGFARRQTRAYDEIIDEVRADGGSVEGWLALRGWARRHPARR